MGLHRVILFVLLVVFIFSTGCVSMTITGKGSVPILLNSPTGQCKVVKHFREWGTFHGAENHDITTILSRTDWYTSENYDAIGNIIIRRGRTFVQGLLIVLTLGLYGVANPHYIEVEGDLLVLRKSAEEPKPAESKPEEKKADDWWGK